MSGAQAIRVLKRDVFGRVERVDLGGRTCVRRVACGSRVPLSRWVARRLLARERRALRALDGLTREAGHEGCPRLIEDEAFAALATPGEGTPRRADVLLRSWIDGAPLSHTESLPEDYFDLLDALVATLHARGVCHNDLHKEQNVMVGADGRPRLVDFQLASLHARPTRTFASRVREDLRHVQKHRRRYLRDGRGPEARADVQAITAGAGYGLSRSWIARTWIACGKPLYRFVTRGILGTRDGEERRPSSGPWPRWEAPVGACQPPQAAGEQSAGPNPSAIASRDPGPIVTRR